MPRPVIIWQRFTSTNSCHEPPLFTGFGVLCSLRWWRFREGARSVGPGLGARLHLGPAGDVAPLFSHSDVSPSLQKDRRSTFIPSRKAHHITTPLNITYVIARIDRPDGRRATRHLENRKPAATAATEETPERLKQMDLEVEEAHGCTKCNMRKLAFFRASSK